MDEAFEKFKENCARHYRAYSKGIFGLSGYQDRINNELTTLDSILWTGLTRPVPILESVADDEDSD